MNKNLELASHVLNALIAQGVREFCICPGARNAPLITLLSSAQKIGVKLYSFYEERSAAFFAVGRIRRTSAPVAVITTSGTAVGELLPAVMEAYYTQLPLVLITADRPRRYRGSGAPQAAEQVGIFGIYSGFEFDLEGDERVDLSSLSWDCPVHLNLCFDEPLLDTQFIEFCESLPGSLQKRESQMDFHFDSSSMTRVREFFQSVRHPLVIVGMLKPEEQESVVELLQVLQCPTYLEATSGLREDHRCSPFQILLSDRIRERMNESSYPWDGVIRLGGIPTLRLWRDLDVELKDMRVLSVSEASFTGLGRASSLATGRLDVLSQQIIQELTKLLWKVEAEKHSKFMELDQQSQAHLKKLFTSEPDSEPSFFHALSVAIPKKSIVYVGNSLPIRQWDLAATHDDRGFDVWASRGLNGIDGQVSTFLGYAQSHSKNWAILGDLTALYDLPGPWILSQLKDLRMNLVVINNGGGKIFSRMFQDPVFQNHHSFGFKAWADLWGLDYECWERAEQIQANASRSRIIEIKPDPQSTERFWREYQKIG